MNKHVLAIIPDKIIESLSKKDLIVLLQGEQSIRVQMQGVIDKLSNEKKILEEEIYEINGKYIRLKSFVFNRSSEKSPQESTSPKKNEDEKEKTSNPKNPLDKNGRVVGKKNKSLPERYPNLPVIEQEVEFDTAPECSCCQSKMQFSGMTEDSEFLDVKPKQYRIIRRKRQKFRCLKCHGDIKTAPSFRIKPGSAYSDELIIDVALSKYCDLIPIERYAAMAARQGLDGIPANSLISLTHYLADFVHGAYLLAKNEILASYWLNADETTHRMLEGDIKKGWYLWGFSSLRTVYFEYHNSRAGKVASLLLSYAAVVFLLTDVFSGYSKAIKEINKIRRENNLREVVAAYCNAHARRKFKEAEIRFPEEVQFYLNNYKKIYSLEALLKNISPRRRKKRRRKMFKIFAKMRLKALEDKQKYSNKSEFVSALNYFLNNYEGLTLFIKNPNIPIDNNRQERLLRNPVIGRKTWYGTHSKRGAKTAAILFTLVESCKLNNVNPREYFRELVKDLHAKKAPYTPAQYRDRKRQGKFSSLESRTS